jgi:hypothetical protein
MASRLNALRKTAMETGEEIGHRATEIAQKPPASNTLFFVLAAIAGFGFGIITGLLIAPTSGVETRSMLENRASEMLSSARQKVKEGEEQVSEKAEQIA